MKARVGTAAALAVLLAGCGSAANASSSSTTVTTAKGSSTTASTSAQTTTTVAAVLFQQSGSGTASTANFTAPTNWDIAWSYDCSAAGGQGNFIVSVEQAGTGSVASLEDEPINQLGASGSGTQHYHYGGKLYLSVDSECTWTLKAVPAS